MESFVSGLENWVLSTPATEVAIWGGAGGGLIGAAVGTIAVIASGPENLATLFAAKALIEGVALFGVGFGLGVKNFLET